MYSLFGHFSSRIDGESSLFGSGHSLFCGVVQTPLREEEGHDHWSKWICGSSHRSAAHPQRYDMPDHWISFGAGQQIAERRRCEPIESQIVRLCHFNAGHCSEGERWMAEASVHCDRHRSYVLCHGDWRYESVIKIIMCRWHWRKRGSHGLLQCGEQHNACPWRHGNAVIGDADAEHDEIHGPAGGNVAAVWENGWAAQFLRIFAAISREARIRLVVLSKKWFYCALSLSLSFCSKHFSMDSTREKDVVVESKYAPRREYIVEESAFGWRRKEQAFMLWKRLDTSCWTREFDCHCAHLWRERFRRFWCMYVIIVSRM